MKRLAIVYFSGTGNTKYIANKMKDVFIRNNIAVDFINIEKDRLNVYKYDYIVIGGPIYVERYPEILLKYLEKNLSGFNGSCMLYTTQANTGRTSAFKHAMKRLKKLNVTYFDYIIMPNNFYNFMFKQYPEEKLADLIKESSKKAEKMALDFCRGNNRGYEIPNRTVFMVEAAYRFTYPFLRNFLMRKLKVDSDKCTKCRVCEKFCPAQSIKITPKLRINNHCTFCQRCIHSCPNNAFLYKGKPIVQYKLKI